MKKLISLLIILSLIVLPRSISYAIVPDVINLRDFKGIVTNPAPHLIEPGATPLALNVGVINGQLSPLPGFTRVSATPLTATDKDDQFFTLYGTEYEYDFSSSDRLELASSGAAMTALGTPSAPTLSDQLLMNIATAEVTCNAACDQAYQTSLSDEGTYAFFQTYYLPNEGIESKPSTTATNTVDNLQTSCNPCTWRYDFNRLVTASPDTDWGADCVVKVYGGGSNGFGLFGTFTGSTTLDMQRIPSSRGELPEVFVPLAAPAGDFAFTFANSLFIGTTNKLYWSTFRTGSTTKLSYSEDFRLDFDTNEDDDENTLVGGVGTAQFALVYSKKATWAVNGNNWRTFKNNLFPLSREAGGVNRYAVTTDSAGNAYIFGGDSGVTRITQRYEITNIALPIMDILTGVNTDTIAVDTADYDSMRTLYDPRRNWVWFFVQKTNSTANNAALIWDVTREQWYIKDNIPGRAAWRETDADGQISLYVIDGSGYQYQISDNAFIDYDMGGTQTGSPTSTISIGGNTLTDTGASFTTTGGALTNAYLIVVEGTTIEKASISSNTGTVITRSGTWANAFTTAAVYYVGYQDFDWYSKWFDADQVNIHKAIEKPVVNFVDPGSNQNTFVTFYIDYSATAEFGPTTINMNDTNKSVKLGDRIAGQFVRMRIRSITGSNNPRVRSIVLPIQARGEALYG